MPDDFNPYKPPADAPPPTPVMHPLPAAPWHPFEAFRQGDVLVLSKSAALPDVCMKCGRHEPGIFRRLVHFSWLPPYAPFLFCLGAIGIVIAFAVLQKRAPFFIPLCADCNARWTRATRIMIAPALLLAVTTMAVLFGRPLLFDEDEAGLALALLAGTIACGVVALVVVQRLVVRPCTVWATRIDERYLHAGGVADAAIEAVIELSRTHGRLQPAAKVDARPAWWMG
jgi:hypothetical protein